KDVKQMVSDDLASVILRVLAVIRVNRSDARIPTSRRDSARGHCVRHPPTQDFSITDLFEAFPVLIEPLL
ncbi:hypothetical protein FOMPIDRAFT_1024423, partial [Fomitopsis schrenkii]